MTELVVATFPNSKSAFLARAALARMQEQLLFNGSDMAVVSREEGRVTVQEAIHLGTGEAVQKSFWKVVVGALFDADPTGTAGGTDAAARLRAIGVGKTFTENVRTALRLEGAAIFVLVQESGRDRLTETLRGLGDTIVRASLRGESREHWLSTLCQGGEGMEDG